MKLEGGQSAGQTYCSFNYALGFFLMKLSSITPKGKEIAQWCAPQMDRQGSQTNSSAIAQVFNFVFGRKPMAGRFKEDQVHFATQKEGGVYVMASNPVPHMLNILSISQGFSVAEASFDLV